MKITVINGNAHHGSTWNCTDLIIRELSKYDEIEKTEFFLPKDMPHFCNGCYSCFLNGEVTCPHAAAVTPIAAALLEADLIVLTSSVYALDVTGQLKALLDHLCYMWISHRPDARMFGKIGLTVATTAGAGLNHTTKTMRNTLKYWCLQKTFSFKGRVAAMKWSEVSAKKQAEIGEKTAKLAKRIAKAVKNTKKLPNPMFRSLMFMAMKGAQKKNDWNPTDRKHWEEQGWLGGVRPF